MSWREQVTFDSMIMMPALQLDLYSASLLKQQPAGIHVALLSDALP